MAEFQETGIRGVVWIVNIVLIVRNVIRVVSQSGNRFVRYDIGCESHRCVGGEAGSQVSGRIKWKIRRKFNGYSRMNIIEGYWRKVGIKIRGPSGDVVRN